MPHHHRDGLHGRQNLWDGFTSVVGNVLGGGGGGNQNGPRAAAGSTVYRTVYHTMAPTFSGQVGSYTTVDSNDPPAPSQPPVGPPKPSDLPSTLPKSLSIGSLNSLPTSLVVDHKTTGGFGLATQTSATTPIPTTAASTDTGGDSGASSTGTKAGIAIGVLAGVALVFFAVWFLLKKRRQSRERLDDDEKPRGGFLGRSASTRTTPDPPRLSLRPVTQLFPSFMMDKRSSRGANIALGASPTQNQSSYQIGRGGGGASAWERPGANRAGGHDHHPQNPFGDHAHANRAPSPIQEERGPFNRAPSPTRDVGVAGLANALGGAAGGAAAAAAVADSSTRRTSMVRKDGPQPLDLTKQQHNGGMGPIPPSPAGTDYSVSSMAPGQAPPGTAGGAAIAAAGGPANSAVFRVQLDFKPTLEDELELRAGQLVRMLHEYDDGWALVIRLDRSEQGVVPRTCLSTRPVKPRPAQGGPRGPPVNPMGGPNRGPGYPPQGHPMSPGGGPGPYGMPDSPQRPRTAGGPGGRSQSPGPGGYGSPQGYRGDRGMMDGNRRMSPPGPSPMGSNGGGGDYRSQGQGGGIGRKPVPGQAY